MPRYFATTPASESFSSSQQQQQQQQQQKQSSQCNLSGINMFGNFFARKKLANANCANTFGCPSVHASVALTHAFEYIPAEQQRPWLLMLTLLPELSMHPFQLSADR